MAGQDIHPAITGNTIYNGSLVVNPGSPFLTTDNGCVNHNTSYADITKPVMADISGKYDTRFDDISYYGKSG